MNRPGAYFRQLKERILRDRLSPNRVAAGWALGMFVGCSIPFGFQLVVSVPLATLLRVSKVGATLGTFITNPLTIFFIYPAQTLAVHRVLFGGTAVLPSEWTWSAVRVLAGDVIVSFFLGGLLLALVLTPPTFFAVRRLVVASRNRRGV